ncbi:MAG: hypothetical protein M0R75_04850 [Dehalococcoidia bacterium]|nr:hypothetical protein [Dehalococcoidia bacterium]
MGAGLWSRARRGRQIPHWVGPTALLLVSVFFIGVVVWGWLNPADIKVEYFDAGPAHSFEIGKVAAFPEQDTYIVGMQDGRLRAIDVRVQQSGCTAVWKPEDARGAVANPGGVPGVFEDPCTGAIWSMEANAIEDAEVPLKTPYIDYRPGEGGTHAFVERVNP